MSRSYTAAGREAGLFRLIGIAPQDATAGTARMHRVPMRTIPWQEMKRRNGLLLWLDAVGGFLVCLDDCVVLGQPAGGDRIAVPIMADVSRRHAVIRREAGTYVLEPLHRTRVDGREINAAVRARRQSAHRAGRQRKGAVHQATCIECDCEAHAREPPQDAAVGRRGAAYG